MAEENTTPENENENEQPEAEAEATPEPETPAEEPAAEAETPEPEAAEEAPVEDAPAEEPVAEEPPAEEPPPRSRRPRSRARRRGRASAEEALPAEDAEPAAEDKTPAPAAAPAAEGSTDKPVRERRRSTKSKREKRAQREGLKARAKLKDRGAKERKPLVRLPKPEHERSARKERRGVVVSDAMEKTIVVRVETARPHRRYKKVIRRSTKFHAHDEQGQAKVGDLVRIVETRPLSKTKNWRLAEVLEAAK